MEEKNEELLPCPFCGGKPTLCISCDEGVHVICLDGNSGCGNGTMFYVNEDIEAAERATQAWNRRAQ